jgi:sulfonate transport system substrate-binding protein
LPESILDAEYKKDPFVRRFSPLIDDFILVRFKESVADAKVLSLIRKDFDVDAFFDKSFLEQAIKELKLTNQWKPLSATGK